jgi:hypothetical protein
MSPAKVFKKRFLHEIAGIYIILSVLLPERYMFFRSVYIFTCPYITCTAARGRKKSITCYSIYAQVPRRKFVKKIFMRLAHNSFTLSLELVWPTIPVRRVPIPPV